MPMGSALQRQRFGIALALFFIGASFFFISGRTASAQSKTQLSSSTALYARLVRISHHANTALNGKIVASVTAFPGGVGEQDIYTSSDGASFALAGAIHDADFSGGLCCGTLFELPRAIGTLPAGTLIWSGSVGQSSTTQAMQLKVYASQDGGATWTYLSTIAVTSKVGTTGGGLWEPQFTVASDGALVVVFSDETVSGHSQLLRQMRSYNGTSWQDSTYTVASTVQSDRPGMAVITVLPSGLYFMTYEMCGPAACTAFYRTSPDGWSWGVATNTGTRIVSTTGQYFEHTPINAWAPSAVSTNGTILLTGQMLYESNGTVSSGNGATIFVSHSADGSGPWTTMPAPVQVPTAYNNYCPNYSSPLLPSVDGTSVLEFASDYVGTTCTMYYGSGSIQAGTVTPSVTVTPATSNVSSYPLQVTVTVAGNGSLPTPTGKVTLSSGSYTATQALVNGVATFSIAGPLTAGSGTLTAAYVGDANYTAATGTASVTVVAAGLTVSSSALTVKAGATSSNSIPISITPSGGFTGVVTLSAAIQSSPAGSVAPPTFSFSPANTVTLSSASAASATLVVSTTATTAALQQPQPLNRTPQAPLAYAGLLLLAGFSGVRRMHGKGAKGIWIAVMMLAVFISMTSCSGKSSPTSSAVQGTTPGTYMVQVVAASGSLSATSQFTLTVQ